MVWTLYDILNDINNNNNDKTQVDVYKWSMHNQTIYKSEFYFTLETSIIVHSQKWFVFSSHDCETQTWIKRKKLFENTIDAHVDEIIFINLWIRNYQQTFSIVKSSDHRLAKTWRNLQLLIHWCVLRIRRTRSVSIDSHRFTRIRRTYNEIVENHQPSVLPDLLEFENSNRHGNSKTNE